MPGPSRRTTTGWHASAARPCSRGAVAPGRRGSARAGGRRRASAGGADAALARASDAIQELTAIVRSQEKELATLREQAAVIDQLQRVLDRSR